MGFSQYIVVHILPDRVKDRTLVSGAFEMDPVYLKHEHQGQIMPDFRVIFQNIIDGTQTLIDRVTVIICCSISKK